MDIVPVSRRIPPDLKSPAEDFPARSVPALRAAYALRNFPVKTILSRGSLAKSALLLPALFLLCPAAGANNNLDGKIRYEKNLEQKAEEVILRLVGPGQAKVIIRATLDFSNKEKVEKLEASPAAGEASEDKNLLFKWQNMNKGGPSSRYLLPGYPEASRLNPPPVVEKGEPVVQKETVFPLAIVKKLEVTLVLNRKLTSLQIENVRKVVTELLGVDEPRGDQLYVIRTDFAPVWYTSEMINMLIKYGATALALIIGMIVVAVGFLKIAEAMNNMAGSDRTQKLNMNVVSAEHETREDGGLLGAGAYEAKDDEFSDEAADGEAPSAEEKFKVRPDQIPHLVKMLVTDNPADIALIAARLNPDVRMQFLEGLPPEVACEVIVQMTEVRFLDTEFIVQMREELERRLSGASGGLENVCEALEKAGTGERLEILKRLEKKHPELAWEVKARFVFFEDLSRLSESDMYILATVVKQSDWTATFSLMNDEFKGKLEKSMSEKMWLMLEQTVKYGGISAAKSDLAVQEIITAAEKLIKEGKISRPPVAERIPPAENAKR